MAPVEWKAIVWNNGFGDNDHTYTIEKLINHRWPIKSSDRRSALLFFCQEEKAITGEIFWYIDPILSEWDHHYHIYDTALTKEQIYRECPGINRKLTGDIRTILSKKDPYYGIINLESLVLEQLFPVNLPTCICDIKQLWRGDGHDSGCPEKI